MFSKFNFKIYKKEKNKNMKNKIYKIALLKYLRNLLNYNLILILITGDKLLYFK